MPKKILFMLSIIFFLIFFIVRLYISNNLIFKENVITQQEFDKIISTKEEYKDFIDVKHNNESIPFDKVNNYYLLSQVEGSKYNGHISIDKFEIDILKNNKSKNEIISTNDNLVILAYNDKYYKIINLKLTCFPVIKLDESSNKVTIYDNDSEREVLNVQKHSMSYHIRGNSTAVSKKKSYKLNILDSKGKKKKVSLLNMRNDDDWILNAMSTDRAYMLEKIGYNIWGKMSEFDIQLKYIELFINNEYKGIYYLQEPADFKTYNANNKSLLISIKCWQTDIKKPILFNENLEYKTLIDEFEFDSKINEEQQIELLRTFISDIREKGYSSKIKLNYDAENIANYSLFINLISAIDNTYKNQKILFRYIDGEYFVELYPWDLDLSQNNEKLKEEHNFLKIVNNVNIPKQILQSESYNKLLINKYNSLRETVYNEKYLYDLIDSNKKEIEKSGAIFREEKVWGDRDLDKSIQNLKELYSEKIKILDNYYGGR